MTLVQAMGTLLIELEAKNILGQTREHDAIKLGIEALKRLKWYRKYHRIDADTPLPGET